MIEIKDDGTIQVEDGAGIEDLSAFLMDAVNGTFMRELLPKVAEVMIAERGELFTHNFLQDLERTQNRALAELEEDEGPIIGPFDYGA
jgi:pheromone shutdown protein TraB